MTEILSDEEIDAMLEAISTGKIDPEPPPRYPREPSPDFRMSHYLPLTMSDSDAARLLRALCLVSGVDSRPLVARLHETGNVEKAQLNEIASRSANDEKIAERRFQVLVHVFHDAHPLDARDLSQLHGMLGFPPVNERILLIQYTSPRVQGGPILNEMHSFLETAFADFKFNFLADTTYRGVKYEIALGFLRRRCSQESRIVSQKSVEQRGRLFEWTFPGEKARHRVVQCPLLAVDLWGGLFKTSGIKSREASDISDFLNGHRKPGFIQHHPYKEIAVNLEKILTGSDGQAGANTHDAN